MERARDPDRPKREDGRKIARRVWQVVSAPAAFLEVARGCRNAADRIHN